MRKIRDYFSGDIIDDMIVDETYFDKEKGMTIAICHCQKCYRQKKMSYGCLREHKGTTHKACGQYIKTQDSRFHSIWSSMKNRIYNENYEYYNRYGGRGLTCDYDLFIDFYDDMYEEYIQAISEFGYNISVDRIDNNLGYIRGNLRFTTQEHQVRNSSKVKEFYAISPQNYVYLSNNQTQFAINHGLSPKQVSAVLNKRFSNTFGWKFIFKSEVENFPFFAELEMYY